MPSAKVLQHATSNPSKQDSLVRVECVQIFLAGKMLNDSRIGRIVNGAFADLLVLDANPLDDVKILDRPEEHLLAVIKGGRVVTSKLENLKAESMW